MSLLNPSNSHLWDRHIITVYICLAIKLLSGGKKSKSCTLRTGMRKQCSACGAVSNALNGMSSSNLGSFVHNLKNEASELQAATKELKGEILKAKQAQRSALENKMSAITWTWLGIAKEKKKHCRNPECKDQCSGYFRGY